MIYILREALGRDKNWPKSIKNNRLIRHKNDFHFLVILLLFAHCSGDHSGQTVQYEACEGYKCTEDGYESSQSGG
jgi:hypothetical protein